jgi:hypothetical protein
MIAFLIELHNKPGAVAEVTEAIAERGINITGGAGIGAGSTGYMALTTNDEAGTRRVLLAAPFTFREIEIVPLTVADTPGAFAKASRALGDAGVNIEAAFAMTGTAERTTIAFATSDPAKARSILSQKSVASGGRSGSTSRG